MILANLNKALFAGQYTFEDIEIHCMDLMSKIQSFAELGNLRWQSIQGLHKTAAMTNDSFDDGTNPHLAGCSKMSRRTSTRQLIVVYIIDISCHICPAMSC